MDRTLDIDRDRRAPGRARQAVRDVGRALDAAVVDDAILLVSELVANSVRYGRNGAVRLRMASRAPRHLRVEVSGDGPGFTAVPRDRPLTEAGGWGLHLVDRLADDWGARRSSNHVWFEIDRG